VIVPGAAAGGPDAGAVGGASAADGAGAVDGATSVVLEIGGSFTFLIGGAAVFHA
jgi:hypothetical protein